LTVAGPPGIWVWTSDPLEIAPIFVAATLYSARARSLERSGRPVPTAKRWAFAAGLACALLAVVSPIDSIGETSLFSAHMVQHILLGDIAPLLVVLGLNRALLRPLLALPLLGRVRVLVNPLVSLPLWAVDLYLWHTPPLYGLALADDGVHALEHAMFFACGGLMWAALLELLPGPHWFGNGARLLYVLGVRVAGMVLGNVFVWSGRSFYPHYEHAVRLWGLDAAADQSLGGVIMLGECSLVTLAVFAWLLLRWAADSELRQILLERGLPERTVDRAVRYRRAKALLGGEAGGTVPFDRDGVQVVELEATR
jgi:cytochrome c oxidase assembly factor CtaG